MIEDEFSAAVAERVAQLSRRLKAEAGGLELAGIDRRGTVNVRFTGMCTGCFARPLTLNATVRPALLELDGVTDVAAAGTRVSEEAQARLARYFQRPIHRANPPADKEREGTP